MNPLFHSTSETTVLPLAAVIVVLLITWAVSFNSFDVQEKARNILITTAPKAKCGLSRVCPPDHFAFYIVSGAANVVGPKICFEGKIIMSNVKNNVGSGLNIVVVNEKLGDVETIAYLNMKIGNADDILAYLKNIYPGMIVLVASFDDVTAKMTDEMREVFVGMGSTLITSVKRRDNWVFAGRAGRDNKSLFEKQAANDESTNVYGDWPEAVELSGCYPRNHTDGKVS
ncbi:protein FAM3C-like isoform X1 [Notothenia coriiceps]|uniref:Protein FAM3C-like isoform X1 n=1 Tax=Notothenia coriiceps TaxID=8208 RepID=A0A6I9NXP2_9TELE|nr:PREDICTED: protein FAM3C-like isoform X1 [Notothenia coriiceps]